MRYGRRDKPLAEQRISVLPSYLGNLCFLKKITTMKIKY